MAALEDALARVGRGEIIDADTMFKAFQMAFTGRDAHPAPSARRTRTVARWTMCLPSAYGDRNTTTIPGYADGGKMEADIGGSLSNEHRLHLILGDRTPMVDWRDGGDRDLWTCGSRSRVDHKTIDTESRIGSRQNHFFRLLKA